MASLVTAARVGLVLAALGAVVLAFALARRPDEANGAPGFVCPMHAQVRARAPGTCPVCGMALVRAGGGADSAPDEPPRLSPGAVEVARRQVVAQEPSGAAWLETSRAGWAVIHDDDLICLHDGERGTFTPTAGPAERIRVRLDRSRLVRWDDTTSRAALVVEQGGPALAPGTVGMVEWPARRADLLILPASALLFSGEETAVISPSPDGRHFPRRPVRVGGTNFGLTAVLEGLGPGERVAVRDGFFLDAERRLGEDPAR